MMKQYKNIDEYIKNFPDDIQEKLKQMRSTIAAAAPEAEEKISYGIPTFAFHGNLVHFGANKTHIGFYPGPAGVETFKDQLASYDTSKGTIRLPLNKPLPLDLVREIVRYRVTEHTKKK